MKVRTLLAAAAFAVTGTLGHAATIALSADNAEAIGGIANQDFTTELGNAGATHLYSGNMSLITDGPVKVKFSLVGAESDFTNRLQVNGVSVIKESETGGNGGNGLADFTAGALDGEMFEIGSFTGDLASILTFQIRNFNFANNTPEGLFYFGAADDEFGVFANSADVDSGALTTFYLALDDDGGNTDDNHDDIIIRVDVSAVPLPASGLLLLAGLGGAFGMRRLRKAS